ncbi:MAG: NAD-dependent DNA ligase LigA [Chitinophagales bacterium]|nr:NAD-dependent DNA ligase LigA [Chitinophagales bacterium]
MEINEELIFEQTTKLLNIADNDVVNDPLQIAEELRSIINYLDWKYYVKSETLVQDYDYDRLYKLLRKIEEENPDLITEDSPTRRVARGLSTSFPTVRHMKPMLSLDNSYNYTDLKDFDLRVKKLSGQETVEYCVEPKFDGSSIALVYENNMLVRAATRGDGNQGDDITNNAKTIRSIPLSADFLRLGIARVELRGEVVISQNFFHKMNKEREGLGLPAFQNARNTASGGLRMKDSKEVAKRGLEAFIYQIGIAEDDNGEDKTLELISQSKSIDLLHDLGFKTTKQGFSVFNAMEDVLSYCHAWESKREGYPYEIDGMVVKANRFETQEQVGYTSHHPRWAIAFKFKAKQARSKLERIEYQVGRTGAITPVAKITPVSLAGVTISSVSLHNEDFIKDKELHLNDIIIVERAGDVIPYIVGPVIEERTNDAVEIKFPEECPSCSSPLVKEKEEVAWRCVNIDCPAQTEERLIHFVSKGAMNIDGLGKDIIRRFYKEEIIKHIPDLYRLNYDQILQLEGWKQKSVENLRSGIEKSKENETWRLLVGLGIRHVGSTTAKMLSKHVRNIKEFSKWDIEALTALEDIGPIVAESLYDFFRNDSNLKLLDELEELGVNMERKETMNVGNLLQGKSFLFTGSMQKLTRDRAKELVEQNGGKILSSVSKNLNFLVVGEKAGSKLTKAQGIETIEIIDEDSFLKMIGE